MKNFTKSLTLWGLAVTLLGQIGIPVEAGELQFLYETVVTVVGVIMTVYGRARADKPLTLT